MFEIELDIPIDADTAIYWQDGILYLLDQRQLPQREVFIRCDDAGSTAEAITAMVVRGAPAIGITAAYGVAMAARKRFMQSASDGGQLLIDDMAVLAASRPTAVNLFWAIARCRDVIEQAGERDPSAELVKFACDLHAQDKRDNHRIGDFGASLIAGPTGIITHCNAGALATGGYGTALGVIRSAFTQNKVTQVFADETRPWLQGSRLTAWELVRDNIPVQLLADGAAAARMAAGGIGWVVVGSDRIAANGDVANKIGTYSLAVAARYHGIKFMVAAPTSTIDTDTLCGADIPIETRDSNELLTCAGKRIAAQDAGAWNPVFDVTPAELVDAIVTERGIIYQPNAALIAAHLSEDH